MDDIAGHFLLGRAPGSLPLDLVFCHKFLLLEQQQKLEKYGITESPWNNMKQRESRWMNSLFNTLGNQQTKDDHCSWEEKKMLLWAFAAQEILMTWGRERMSSWKSWRNTRTSWRTALLEGAKYTVTYPTTLRSSHYHTKSPFKMTLRMFTYVYYYNLAQKSY